MNLTGLATTNNITSNQFNDALLVNNATSLKPAEHQPMDQENRTRTANVLGNIRETEDSSGQLRYTTATWVTKHQTALPKQSVTKSPYYELQKRQHIDPQQYAEVTTPSGTSATMEQSSPSTSFNTVSSAAWSTPTSNTGNTGAQPLSYLQSASGRNITSAHSGNPSTNTTAHGNISAGIDEYSALYAPGNHSTPVNVSAAQYPAYRAPSQNHTSHVVEERRTAQDSPYIISSAPSSTSSTTAFPGYINLQNFSRDLDYLFGSDDFGGGGGPGASGSNYTCAGGGYGFNSGGSDNVTSVVPLCMAVTTNDSNLTDAGLGGDEKPAVRYWALLLLCFPLLTVFGNALVVLAVHRERSLRTVTNYFIVSLAAADIFIGLVVMPLAVYVEVNSGAWLLGNVLCDAWVACDVMGSTASILNLTAISVDRFIAVTQPLRYAKHKNSPRRVHFMLVLSWLLSIAISSPIALGMNYTDSRIETPNLCVFYNSDFLIYSSMGSFYIPCVIMVFLYWKIFRTIHLRAKRSLTAKMKTAATIKNRNATCMNVIDNRRTTGMNVSGQAASRIASPQCSPLCTTKKVQETVFANAAITTVSSAMAVPQTTTTDTGTCDEESVASGKPMLPGSALMSPTSGDDSDQHVVIANDHHHENNEENHVNNKRGSTTGEEFIVSPTSDESPNEFMQRVDGDSGYSAPHTVEVTSPASTRQLLSPPMVQSPRPVRSKLFLLSGIRQHLSPRYKQRHNCSGNGRNSNGATDIDISSSGTPTKKHVTKFNFHLRHNKKKKDRSLANRREKKAVTTLAIVLGVFLICWLPFFTVNIINAICIRLDRKEYAPDPLLMSLFVWLGYINSFLNPVIYTIFNTEFRKAFKKILSDFSKDCKQR